MQTHLVRVAVFASLGLAAACANPSEGKSKAEVSAPAPALAKVTPTPGQAEPETVPIAAGESKIAWVGAKVTKRHDGGFNKWDGKVELAGELEQSRLSFTIDMASVFTDSEKLAGHLRSPDFFDVAKYPTATFVSTGIAKGGDKGATHTVTGNLNLHGVEKSVSFPATIRLSEGRVEADSEFVINRKDFGIVYPGMPDDLIRDEVVLKLTIRAPRPPKG